MKIPKIFFFIADHVVYDDSIIYLAEGLKELNIEFYANRNYWQENVSSNSFLFQYRKEVNWQDCDIIIFSYTWTNYTDPATYNVYSSEFPKGLFNTKRTYKTVYIDPTDGYRTKSWDEEFRKFDIILRAKYNNKTYNPSNVKPWVLGYSKRIVDAVRDQKSFEERRKVILQNFYFTHSYDHGTRSLAIKKILPEFEKKYLIDKTVTLKNTEGFSEYDRLMWNQTEGKHQPSYYHLLGNAIANACFCGEMIPGLPADPSCYMKGGNKYRMINKFFSAISFIGNTKPRIIQWDSWRFWESLVAGCIPIHLDLAKYGVEIPIMPSNWTHYVGIDLSNIKRDIERFCEDEEALKTMAHNGKEWVIRHYSPVESAKRFLNIIQQ